MSGHEGLAPDPDQDNINSQFRVIDETEHLAEPDEPENPDLLNRPIPSTDSQDPDIVFPEEISWGIPGAPFGDGTL